MKSKLLGKFTRHWATATILLTLATLSNSHALTASRWHQVRLVGKTNVFRFMSPERSRVNSEYQPPRSPGYHEDFGS
jgi:hypothetical protein